MDPVHVGGLGGTYGGNPLACEAALGVLETIAEQDLVAKARRIGEIMLPRLHALRERFDIIGDVRGRGAMIAIELVGPRLEGAEPGRRPGDRQALPRGRASWCSRRARTATCCASCRRS